MTRHIARRKIMWGDLDALGIVFYPRYNEWIDACGHLFFESLGLGLGVLWRERGINFGLAETSCRYRSPGRYHEEIEIVTTLEEVKSKTVLLKHLIRRRAGGGIMVEGYEKRVCLDCSDPSNLRAVSIPADIARRLRDAMNDGASRGIRGPASSQDGARLPPEERCR
jgi:4-hydroxybenzoyl-CoA thioesterase